MIYHIEGSERYRVLLDVLKDRNQSRKVRIKVVERVFRTVKVEWMVPSSEKGTEIFSRIIVKVW